MGTVAGAETYKLELRPHAVAAPNSLQWHHNERDGVSNHQPLDCLLNRLLKHRSKKQPKLRVTVLCEGNSPVTGEFPAQRASNAENVSIWWRHRVSQQGRTLQNKKLTQLPVCPAHLFKRFAWKSNFDKQTYITTTKNEKKIIKKTLIYLYNSAMDSPQEEEST